MVPLGVVLGAVLDAARKAVIGIGVHGLGERQSRLGGHLARQVKVKGAGGSLVLGQEHIGAFQLPQ